MAAVALDTQAGGRAGLIGAARTVDRSRSPFGVRLRAGASASINARPRRHQDGASEPIWYAPEDDGRERRDSAVRARTGRRGLYGGPRAGLIARCCKQTARILSCRAA